MPILQAEPTYYPEHLFDDSGLAVSEPSGIVEGENWWALYTRPRAEKMLLRKLRAWQTTHYCPIAPQRRSSGRPASRVSRIPLFANYVFLRGTEVDRYRAACSGDVLRCITVPEPVTFFEQLRTIEQMIVSGLPIELECGLQVGAEVRVKSGALRGLRGRIVKRHNQSRFLVYLNFLECGASTLFDNWDIEAI
ncbi:antitermination protein NusG [bacterium]|nr:antitermination protein NusG [bacterium]